MDASNKPIFDSYYKRNPSAIPRYVDSRNCLGLVRNRSLSSQSCIPSGLNFILLPYKICIQNKPHWNLTCLHVCITALFHSWPIFSNYQNFIFLLSKTSAFEAELLIIQLSTHFLKWQGIDIYDEYTATRTSAVTCTNQLHWVGLANGPVCQRLRHTSLQPRQTS